MTLLEATELAGDLNEVLIGSGDSIYIQYGVFAYWNAKYEKLYNVVLYPTAHTVKFGAANDSQLLAFARVSLTTILAKPANSEVFVTVFNANAALDTELNDYLTS